MNKGFESMFEETGSGRKEGGSLKEIGKAAIPFILPIPSFFVEAALTTWTTMVSISCDKHKVAPTISKVSGQGHHYLGLA
jgi:hypothetical protein